MPAPTALNRAADAQLASPDTFLSRFAPLAARKRDVNEWGEGPLSTADGPWCPGARERTLVSGMTATLEPTTTASPRPLARHNRWAGAGTLTGGSLLLGIGIGIGLRHLLAVGLTPLALVGLLALGAGLVLIVMGGRRLLQGVRWQWKLVAVPGAVVAGALVVWTVAPAFVAAVVPDVRLGASRPSVAYQDVTFVTADGVTLSAWYLPSSNGAAVVLRHGSGSTRT
ncbi:MAG TPA: hypothetical protein VF855_10355, partial [Acidimicrobiales bacterium]